MYNDTLNGSTEKRSAELPDAVGPIVQLHEKLYVPVKEYPDVSIFCLYLFFFFFLLHILLEEIYLVVNTYTLSAALKRIYVRD